jgi:hypothetical protein
LQSLWKPLESYGSGDSILPNHRSLKKVNRPLLVVELHQSGGVNV